VSRIHFKKILLVAFFGLLFAVSFFSSYLYFSYKNIVVKSIPNEDTTSPTIPPAVVKDPLAPRNILILGYGGEGHSGGNLTDTMILAHVIPKEKLLILISIPRDIWVSIPTSKDGEEHFKINHAYAIGLDDEKYPDKTQQFSGIAGGGNLSKYAVSIVTGQPIDNFISINFNGFLSIIDILGGLNVNVPQTFEDKYYPIKGKEEDLCNKTNEDIEAVNATMSGFELEKQFECRYETVSFTAGYQYMDSVTALKFARSRHSDTNGNDFARSGRQQAIIAAVKDKLLNFGSIIKIIPIINQITYNVKTDIDIAQAIDLYRNNKVDDITIKTVTLTKDNVLRETYSRDGQYILVPKTGFDDWSSIQSFINSQIKYLSE